MFEFGLDQAAGLRLDMQARDGSPALMPLASPAQPSHGFEWLCRLAMDLADAGQRVVVIDGCATERGERGGLCHALADTSETQLGAAAQRGEWQVMPGARGLQTLVGTAAAGGADTAVSRLFAPFAHGALVLLYAPAQALASLLSGISARVLVPVIDQPQASIDAYGALKWLHGAGLCPVLAPLSAPQQILSNVVDTAQRHLGLRVPVWAQPAWSQRVPDGALVRADTPPFSPHRSPARGVYAGAAHPLWS
ncbi:MAG: hypothetical protein KF871_07340 [Hydrogenophaga sp.]|uniref:MinD/ParA family ATP-binding protein n=1 Tax=Hydrogenophaga sp. TaxID=1904254 RepID=UPI001D98B04E|nr:hypothetical protein [Hydrogenophaga sp.]MBX3609698.1 hypothetical protein [Hydrogenophaga sp.]